MAATTSFHTENCSHLVSEHEASEQCQFLIYSTFVLVTLRYSTVPHKLTYCQSLINCLIIIIIIIIIIINIIIVINRPSRSHLTMHRIIGRTDYWANGLRLGLGLVVH